MKQTPGKIFLAEQWGLLENSCFRRYCTFRFGTYTNEHKGPFSSLLAVNEETLAASQAVALPVAAAAQVLPLLSLISLRSMENKLPAAKFMRIHRSYIVGLDHVAAVGRGTLQVRQQTLPVGDGYREVVDQFLSRWK